MIKQRKMPANQSPAKAPKPKATRTPRQSKTKAAKPAGPKHPRPLRRTETRHHPRGLPCHHYMFFNITCDEYDALRARAAGHCEICGVAEADAGGKQLVIDHFEGGGVSFIRGLVCHKCNAMLISMDEKRSWRSNRHLEGKARAYEANSWQPPSAEDLLIVEQVRRKRRECRLQGLVANLRFREAA